MQSDAMDENSNRIHSSRERLNSSTTHERISTSLETRSTSNATITRNVMVKCSWKHQCKPFDEGHGCESPGAVQVHHAVQQAISDELWQQHRRNSMKSFRRSVTSVQAVHWVCQPDASSREIHTNAEPLTCEVMWVAMSCSGNTRT